MDRSVYVTHRWPPEERASLLLKEDVEWPLSVDRDVWPSYFVFPPRVCSSPALTWFGDAAPPSVAERVIVIDPDPYEGRLLGLHLWASLEGMLACYRQRKRDAAPGVVIAVWLEHVRSVPHQQLQTVLYPDVSPSVLADEWVFLGYDVANIRMPSRRRPRIQLVSVLPGVLVPAPS